MRFENRANPHNSRDHKTVQVQVVIIGAGTSGLHARREVASKTDNYLMIDPGPLGTTCARVGCMPSKVLIQVANDLHRYKSFEQEGIQSSVLEADGKTVMNHVRSLRDRFVRSVMSNFSDWKEKWLEGHAQFIDTNTLLVQLSGEKKNEKIIVKAEKIIIATGSTPIIPSELLPYQDAIITTDSIFELKQLPRSVAVVGLGVIGIEIGQALSRLGVKVTCFSLRKAYGGLTDPKIVNYAHDFFSNEIEVELNSINIISKNPDGGVDVKTTKGIKHFEFIFMAVGRCSNFPNLGWRNLKSSSISMNQAGLPNYDHTTMQIKNSNIFIAGDAQGERGILHEAADEGQIAGINAVADSTKSFIRRTRLTITFSDPNIAVVGQSYRELKKQKIPFNVGKVTYEGQGRAIIKLKEKGLLHIYANPQTGELLGAELFAPEGEHLAHLLAWSIQFKKTVQDLLQAPFYHPTLEEGLRTALRDLYSSINSVEKIKEDKEKEALRLT